MHDSKKEVPMRYKLSIKKANIVNIKVQCNSTSSATVKEELPKHSGKDSMEHCLMYMKHFVTITKRYNWWATGPVVQANVDLAFKTMSRILSDKPVNNLKYTKIPEDMTMTQWLKRIKAIIRMLPHLKPSGKTAVLYIGQGGGKRFTKKDKIKTMLEELEEAHKLNKKINTSQENKQ
eukprot:12739640-Ditylum_brightwellii.AAC.1